MTILRAAQCVAEPSLLTSPEEISPEWLTAVLCDSGAISQPVSTCEVTRFAEGMALLSRLYRVRVRYDSPNENGSTTLVVKLATEDPEQLFIAELLGLYHREAFVYNNLREQLPYRMPACHLAVASDDGRATTVVLEDLSRCRAIDQVAGAPWNVVISCIDAMADQHALWYRDVRLGLLDEVLLPLAHPIYPSALPVVFDPGWDVAREVLGDQIGARLAGFGDRWSTECRELLQRLGEHPTLLHGDWRADNLFFDNDELVVFDFQIAGVGAGAYDLAYFVSQSVSPAIRAGRDREIVGEYVARLEAHGVKRTYGSVWDEYRVALLVCLVYPVAAFRSWHAQGARGRALIEQMFLRASDAIEATGALDLVS